MLRGRVDTRGALQKLLQGSIHCLWTNPRHNTLHPQESFKVFETSRLAATGASHVISNDGGLGKRNVINIFNIILSHLIFILLLSNSETFRVLFNIVYFKSILFYRSVKYAIVCRLKSDHSGGVEMLALLPLLL